MTQPPVIPVSPPTRTSPLKVELALVDAKQVVRVIAYGAPHKGAVDLIHDLDPTAAIWLATQLRSAALAIVEGDRR